MESLVNESLPDDTLELILLRLHSPLWILYAASTCKRWRRIISSAGFRRRFHALHIRSPPVIAGFYYNQAITAGTRKPRFERSPSSATAAVAARHFSLDFVPGAGDTCRWTVKHSRGSLLLLYREGILSGRRDLIVCEPLTRRHVVIPPLKLSVTELSYWSATVILLDGGGAGNDGSKHGGSSSIDMSSFRILCLVQSGSIVRACMFTSGTSSWRETCIEGCPIMHFVGVAAGRRYWHDGKKKVVALDENTLEFSSFLLPDNDKIYNVTIAVGRDGEARVVADGCGNILKIFVKRGGGGGEEWTLEKTLEISAAMLGLPRLGRFGLACSVDDQPEEAGMVLIRVLARGTAMRFCLDMETMRVEPVLGLRLHLGRDPVCVSTKAYSSEFPWPCLH